MAAIGTVTECLQERLGVESISLNRKKLQALLPNRVLPNDLTDERRLAIDSIGLTIIGQRMRVVGVSVGTNSSNGISLRRQLMEKQPSS